MLPPYGPPVATGGRAGLTPGPFPHESCLLNETFA